MSDDPQFPIVQALIEGAKHDPEIMRAFVSIGTMLATPEELFKDATLFEKVLQYANAEIAEDDFPSREELLKLVA